MIRPIAISDSANFYVSAERIFDPTLKNVHVIVLSNNDGCAEARSDEAKALGIKMGEPLHLIRDKVEAHGIRVFSSNYTLYGDISRRVVEVYEDYTPTVEIYSIDECFLDFTGFRDAPPMQNLFGAMGCAVWACRFVSASRLRKPWPSARPTAHTQHHKLRNKSQLSGTPETSALSRSDLVLGLKC